MHARNAILSGFFTHVYRRLIFCSALPLRWRIALLHEPWHVFILNDSIIQGSFNNHCSNTPYTSGVKLNKKKIVTCFIFGGKPSKCKTNVILLGKVIFPPSAIVIVILQRLEAFTFKNCSFQL